MKDEVRFFFRSIPPMEELLRLSWVEPFEHELGRDAVKSLFNAVLDDIRNEARNGKIRLDLSVRDIVERRAHSLIRQKATSNLRAIVNATGVVVHTNLGRSPLPPEALDAVVNVSRGYSTLEYSLEEGTRGERNAHIEWLLCNMIGAEAALVVNNNAGAVLLVLAALARDKEVIVSRGELVEIGGAFRIPDILSFSGARMVEVGCTNCTHLRDYKDAVTDETALLLKVHPSNFRIDGFTESVSREELATFARSRGIVCMEDLGSGLLEATRVQGLDDEPTVAKSLEVGVDLVTFSGDKLLGGPQIGCIAGKRELVERIRNNPLARALRVDKMTLAAFEVILRMYRRGRSDAIPTVRMLRVERKELEVRAQMLTESIVLLLSELDLSSFCVQSVETEDTVGGGAFPARNLRGWGTALSSNAGLSAERLSARLRAASIPVIASIRENRLIFHIRTLQEGDEGRILDALRETFTRGTGEN